MKVKFGKVLLYAVSGIAGLIILIIVVPFIFYPPQYVYRVLVWQESDVNDYLNNFPNHSLHPSPTPFDYDRELNSKSITSVLEKIINTDDIEAFFEKSDTQAFIIIQDDIILYENYFNGASRDSLVTSFSVAKSFTSALIGIGITEGYINSVNDVITDYLPELLERDPRFSKITIKHLLSMAAGLNYESDRTWIINGDDALTTYYPDQRKAAIEFTNIIDDPGEYFQYNKYHPQLLGMILERATGTTVTDFLQDKLWDSIGMEYGGSWSIDSEQSGFEKMETGINARAIDFTKLGRLYLNKGNWNGIQVISSEWVTESTQIERATHYISYYPGMQDFYNSGGYYKYMWWGFLHDDGYDYSAMGDRGQIIYISPQKKLIIVRNGLTYGDVDWQALANELADKLLNPRASTNS